MRGMPSDCLTVLAPLRPVHAERVRALLRPVGDDIKGARRTAGPGRPHVNFIRSQHIHFARFAIFDDPDRGAGHTRLLFASVYDGSLDDHLAELVSITEGHDEIWSACEGYAAGGDFTSFITARAVDPAAFYIAFRDETVPSIQQAIDARRRIEESGTITEAAPPAPSLVDRIGAVFRQIVRALPLPIDLVRAISRHGFGHVYAGTLRILASLDRYAVFRFINRITRNRLPAASTPFTSVALDHCAKPVLTPGDELPAASVALPSGFREDVVTQNQLTLVTVVRPQSVERVRAVMAGINSYARRLSPPGSLIGISSIHFVRWLIIDGGRRLMMVSDYDGSWESYIDEFAEMILSGLDAIWETALSFPPDGARDLPAFKWFRPSPQVPAGHFYRPDPCETVLNSVADTGLRRGPAAVVPGFTRTESPSAS